MAASTNESSREHELQQEIQQLIEEGQCFLAYDLARNASTQFPESVHIQLLSALALIRSGAVSAAHRVLAPLIPRLQSTRPTLLKLIAQTRRLLPTMLGSDQTLLTDDYIEEFAEFAALLVSVGQIDRREYVGNTESLKMLGQIYYESWRYTQDRDDLLHGRDTFLEMHRFSDDLESASNAAFLSWLLGEDAIAQELAGEVVRSIDIPATDDSTRQADRYWGLARQGEASLMLGDCIGATTAFEQAGMVVGHHYSWSIQVRERLELLRSGGLDVPEAILDLLQSPRVVIFSGQRIDPPDCCEPVFPSYLEEAVKRAIRARLDALDVKIGYCTASAGADLLFIEAMLEREAEVHVFLPFDQEDFIRARVRYAGRGWERRFRNVMRLVTRINLVTAERYLGHDILFRFTNQVIDGMTRLRATLLGTNPHLLLVWDPFAEYSAGGVADFMDHWPDIATLHLIQIDDIRNSATTDGTCLSSQSPVDETTEIFRCEPERVIKSMLFADIVGFSKLREEELPGLWQLLAEIRGRIEETEVTADLVESWGDALYVVLPDARHMLSYAFALQEGFRDLDVAKYALSHSLQIRIGLHAGPVYQGRHPFTGRDIIYGSHVSRAARIEPVTIPGQIYASQQFVASLTAEESAVEHARLTTGEDYAPWFICEYLGDQPLAKKYGNQPVYHLRRR